MTALAPYWDPFDTAIDDNPYEVYRQLRDDVPVYHNERHNFWALSRYDDVEWAHRHPEIFSSSHGVTIEQMGAQPMQSGMMIVNDPPEHTRLRALVSRAFTPKRVASLEDKIRAYTRQLMASWVPGEPWDYVQNFAALLPSMVISELLSVPESEREQTRKLIDTCFHIEPDVGMINNTSLTAMFDLHSYIAALIEERIKKPGDNLLSDMAHAEIEGENGEKRRLTRDEAADFGVLIVTAGTETVGKLLGWGALLLGEHPDQQQWLRENPDGISAAIEELLRFEPPSPVQGRFTLDDVERHGVTIPKHSKVTLLTGSAGRDERKYPNADVFDVRRKPQGHVSFGYGIHFCIGAALARMQGKVGLSETLAYSPGFTSDRAASKRVYTSTVRGWHSVSVTSE